MPDELDRFFQCVENAKGWAFQVGVVDWGGRPHTPRLVWKTHQTWSALPDAAQLAEAKAAALSDARFFLTCQRCGEVNIEGHMHDQEICQGCAERHLGVCY